MPNWVDNELTVSGSPEAIAKFKEQAGKAYPVGVDEKTNELEYETLPISFWNFIAPPQEAIESGEFFGTHGFSEGKRVGDTPNNWYNFQSDKWGTKWNACEAQLSSESKTELYYFFQTAWSPPEPVFEAMVEQFPELEFQIKWEEEQGFGAELFGSDGTLEVINEWDIPESHTDYAKKDDLDGCECANSSDPHEWYKDCEGLEEALQEWHSENPDYDECECSTARPEPDLVY